MDPSLPDSNSSQRPPLTFTERNSFLLSGLFVVGVLASILVLGWMHFHQTRRERDLAEAEVEPNEAPKVEVEKADTRLNSLPPHTLLRLPIATSKAEPKPVSTDSLTAEDLPAEIREEEIQNGDAVMSQFWNTSSWSEKGSFVHDPSRVSPLMQRYYEADQKPEIAHGALGKVGFYRMGGSLIQHRIYAKPGAIDVLELALRRQAKGNYVLDWESYVGASEMDWEEFTKTKPTKPVLFRVYASVSDYYNFRYSDANLYLCVRLVRPDREATIYAYCERNGPVARSLAGIISSSNSVPVTVKISYRPDAESAECVNLDALVAGRWLLP
jgi:hypothetical protein